MIDRLSGVHISRAQPNSLSVLQPMRRSSASSRGAPPVIGTVYTLQHRDTDERGSDRLLSGGGKIRILHPSLWEIPNW